MQYKLYNPFICCCIIAPAMVSESGCQSISIPAPEEDTFHKLCHVSLFDDDSRASFQLSTPIH